MKMGDPDLAAQGRKIVQDMAASATEKKREESSGPQRFLRFLEPRGTSHRASIETVEEGLRASPFEVLVEL